MKEGRILLAELLTCSRRTDACQVHRCQHRHCCCDSCADIRRCAAVLCRAAVGVLCQRCTAADALSQSCACAPVEGTCCCLGFGCPAAGGSGCRHVLSRLLHCRQQRRHRR
jgi:hypothetical protein